MESNLDSTHSILQRIVFFLVLLCGLPDGEAATIAVEEHNFAIDVPVTWKPVESPTPGILIERQSADEQKKVLVGAAKIPPDERVAGSRDLIEQIRAAMISGGWTIAEERDVAMSGHFFHRMVARARGKRTAAAYTAFAGDHVYGIQLFSNETDAVRDAEMQAIVSSFRLLGQPQANESEAYRTGYKVGRFVEEHGIPFAIIGLAVIPGVLWLFLRKGKRRRRSRRQRKT